MTAFKLYKGVNLTKKYKVFSIIINYGQSFLILNEDSAKLDNLFVLPSDIGKGYGKLLMNDFLNKIRETTIKNIVLDADPNAQKFYERVGFVKIGEIETSVKDRFLPIMEKKL